MATPICRCRVLYLGSAVPHVTKDGLHGIQEPLRELYPEEGVLGAKGIDSWLSVWSNGLLLENVDEKHKRVTRFFPIDSLHYCAAVRHVTIPGPDGDRMDRFLPLDSPFARVPSVNNPPLFACILRRTSGIKVLECHSFVCKKEMAANALVRCCFHSYADNMYARHLEAGSIYGSVVRGGAERVGDPGRSTLANGSRTSSTSAFVNPIQKVEQWRAYVSHSTKEDSDNSLENAELVSIYDGDENHKVWAGGVTSAADDQNSIYADYVSTLRSSKSVNTTQRSNRPRQLTAPSSPPPPPPPPNKNKNSTAIKTNKKVKSSSRSNLNGHGPSNGRRFQASEFGPMWPPRMMSPHGMPPPGCSGTPPPHLIPGNLYRKLPKSMKGGVPFPPPHVMSYLPMPRVGPPLRCNEEPIYLPSYPPKAFQEQYYMGQLPDHPHQPQGHSPPLPPSNMQSSPAQKPLKFKKLHKNNNINNSSTSASNDVNSNGNNKGSDSETKFNTGIYKKKGHLNERAFSYSIRQEHRSRSHSSLSALNFNDPTSYGLNGNNGRQSPTTNGQSAGNSKATHLERQKCHGNGISDCPNSETALPSTTSKNGGGATTTTTTTTTNGVKNMMNDLNLNLANDVHIEDIEEISPNSEMNPVSRKRIVAAANNHR